MIKLIDLLQEESHSLWWHINNNRKKGKKPARKGSEAFKKAVKAAKEINAVNEYSNDSLDFSKSGLATECLDFVTDLKRYIQNSDAIEQETKMEIDKDMAVLGNKLNQLIKIIDND
jgi:hypothetical protein